MTDEITRGLVIAFLALSSVARVASAQSVTFRGVVNDSATLAPLSRIRVSVLDATKRAAASTTTNERGKFAIPHVPHGVPQPRIDPVAMKTAIGPVDTVLT